MIMQFITEVISLILDPILSVLDFAGVDVDVLVDAATSILEYLSMGWQVLNIFVPTLDLCLGMAVFCVVVEGVYKLYLLVMWVLRKIPVISVQ